MGSNSQVTDTGNAIAGALALPARNEELAQPLLVQPRQPRNLQGLLRFALEATKNEDAPVTSEFQTMDVKRREFLQNALKSLTIDMAQVIQGNINVLRNAEQINSIKLGDPLPDNVQDAFSNLLDLIDDIDIANDFYNMGGFRIFPVCFGSENESVRMYASSALGELCQNNPYCQARALECGLLNVVLKLAQTESGEALTKCLYAISCASREYEPACRVLTAQGGCETLVQLLQATEHSARTKAAFLIRHLCYNHNDAKEKFIELNLIKTIVEQIKKGRDETTEHLLSILVALTENLDSRVLQLARDPSLQLKKTLEDHLKHPDLVTDRFREEKDHCHQLLTKVFKDCPQIEVPNEEVADR